MKKELREMMQQGFKYVFLNGWKEDIEYVLSLSNIKKIDDNFYETI